MSLAGMACTFAKKLSFMLHALFQASKYAVEGKNGAEKIGGSL
jgi:hypothetical protein